MSGKDELKAVLNKDGKSEYLAVFVDYQFLAAH